MFVCLDIDLYYIHEEDPIVPRCVSASTEFTCWMNVYRYFCLFGCSFPMLIHITHTKYISLSLDVCLYLQSLSTYVCTITRPYSRMMSRTYMSHVTTTLYTQTQIWRQTLKIQNDGLEMFREFVLNDGLEMNYRSLLQNMWSLL